MKGRSIHIRTGEEEIFCFPDDGKLTCEVYERPVRGKAEIEGVISPTKTTLSRRIKRGVVRGGFKNNIYQIEPKKVVKNIKGIKFDKAGRVDLKYPDEVVRVWLKKRKKK